MLGKKSLLIAAILGGSLAVGQFAKADTIDLTFQSATGSGPYVYTYDVAISSDGTLNPSASYSEGATVFDVYGYSSGSASFTPTSTFTSDGGSFVVSEPLTGGFFQGGVIAAGGADLSGVYNITLTYTPLSSPTPVVVPASTDLGTLTFTSADPAGPNDLYIGSINAKNPPNGTASKDVEVTTGPVPLPPEAWAGGVLFGLLGMGEFLKARRRVQA
jgi:hypothetical protein